ncbi:carotenoid oxygenase family protein [Candidatus Rariloculus sp.]|uniref:carotenoid oxygenase family protein n=1 Tax=Candidatus Rariloculus sp. TaxID=3101265 RepID=UPI003D10F9A7
MAVDFRDHPLFPRGFNSPTRFEADIHDCEVWGEIPSDIEGTFFRIQCDFAYRPPENEWLTGFNGDGHVSAFRFANGSVDYKSRYVKTDRLMAERRHRRRLWGVYRNHLTDDPLVANVDRGAANTHIYWHGGRMLMLKEDALPYAIDPVTLETFGSWDFHGKWAATSMSAHPKIDPVTGEMIAYGYQARGDLSNDIAIYTINPAGHITKEVWLKSPYLGIIHDIAITQKYIVIPVISRTTSLERLQSGEPMWVWDGSLPTMVGVLPRDGDASDVRWFQGPARNTLHFLNAVDDGNRVLMDLPVSDGERSPSQIKRWTFDMNSRNDRFGEEVISTANGVLARMDDRYLSLPYRYGFVGNSDPSLPFDEARVGARRRVTNTYQRYDLQGGPTSTFYVGDTQSLQESGFVPRKGSTGEGDGYIMGVASNYAEMASELHIVDATRMEEGAVAVVKLPFRLRGGTHVNWFSAAELAEQEASA